MKKPHGPCPCPGPAHFIKKFNKSQKYIMVLYIWIIQINAYIWRKQINKLNNYTSAIRFTRGLVFSFEEFLHSFDEQDSATADFTYITGHPRAFGPHSYMKRTIINDLAPPSEAILKGFNDTTRNYILSIMKNDLCRHEFVTAPSESEVQKVYDHVAEFSAMMGIIMPKLSYLNALNRAQRLHISYIYDRSGVMLAGHVYRVSALRPELAYSFRGSEPDADKERLKLLSKANRYSHYCDMLHFKSEGFTEYDFGGLSDGQSDNIKWRRIDEFKMYFGGTIRPYHNSILYNTIKSKSYLVLRGAPFK
jgi:hypothetical protein